MAVSTLLSHARLHSTSAQDEPGGWNAVVQEALAFTDLSYVDGTSVTLTLPTFPAYDLLKVRHRPRAPYLTCVTPPRPLCVPVPPPLSLTPSLSPAPAPVLPPPCPDR